MTNKPETSQHIPIPDNRYLLPKAEYSRPPAPPCTMFEPKKKHTPWYTVHGIGEGGQFATETCPRATSASASTLNLTTNLTSPIDPQPPGTCQASCEKTPKKTSTGTWPLPPTIDG